MILSKIFKYTSRQIDYVQAFPHAPLAQGEEIYMEIPRGYEYSGQSGTEYVMKLKKNLYGIKQAAANWNKMLTNGLKSPGFKQSDHDPCLFIKQHIMCVIYVDDTIFFSKDDKIIDTNINSLKTWVLTSLTREMLTPSLELK